MQHIKIGIKKSGQGQEAYRIQFKRVLFHEWLRSIGISPNKSSVIGVVKVPEQFFVDFLRGVFDGDGTVYRTKDRRWPDSYVISLGFASASVLFLEWLQKKLHEQCGTTGFISRGANVLQLRYASKDSQTIVNAMYYRKDAPHLPRKFAKAQKIFTIHQLS